jgi:hypothetical protein
MSEKLLNHAAKSILPGSNPPPLDLEGGVCIGLNNPLSFILSHKRLCHNTFLSSPNDSIGDPMAYKSFRIKVTRFPINPFGNDTLRKTPL